MASPLARLNRFPPIILGMLFLAAFLGCGSTAEHRIRQYPEAFQALPEDDRKRIRRSEIRVGDSPLHVYLALGPPNRNNRYVLPEVRPGETWTYFGHFDENGDAFFSTYAFKMPSGRAPLRLRVTFGADGKVAAIDSDPSGPADG